MRLVYICINRVINIMIMDKRGAVVLTTAFNLSNISAEWNQGKLHHFE